MYSVQIKKVIVDADLKIMCTNVVFHTNHHMWTLSGMDLGWYCWWHHSTIERHQASDCHICRTVSECQLQSAQYWRTQHVSTDLHRQYIHEELLSKSLHMCECAQTSTSIIAKYRQERDLSKAACSSFFHVSVQVECHISITDSDSHGDPTMLSSRNHSSEERSYIRGQA